MMKKLNLERYLGIIKKNTNIEKYLITTIIVILSLFLLYNTDVYASDEIERYLITDEYVTIDYVKYPILNNTINYQGKIYKIENSILITTDNNGNETKLLLPFKENKVTDPEEIAELNRAVEITELNRTLEENITQNKFYLNSVNYLIYPTRVPSGQYLTRTPSFSYRDRQAYYTRLQITDLPWNANKTFNIKFAIRDLSGEWIYHEEDHDFTWDQTCDYLNYTSMDYGLFIITNLYDAPSYTYSVYTD